MSNDQSEKGTYRVRLYGEKTVDIDAESADEAASKASSETDTGELTPFVEGTPEEVDDE